MMDKLVCFNETKSLNVYEGRRNCRVIPGPSPYRCRLCGCEVPAESCKCFPGLWGKPQPHESHEEWVLRRHKELSAMTSEQKRRECMNW